MKRRGFGIALLLCTLALGFLVLHGSSGKNGRRPLPSSKLLLEPVPGHPRPTNSFPAAIALPPDGKHRALLNDGYATFESDYRQSIAALDIAAKQLTNFPDPRL